MASRRRSDIVQPLKVGAYHCIARCVRRAYLCGQDPLTGKDYTHRRKWITDCEKHLAGLFAIEVGFHAELVNHIHVEMRNRPDIVEIWSDEDVVRRWLSITHLAKSKDGTLRDISPGQIAIEKSRPGRVQELRERLSDPSWFMAVLEEHIARRCNREDGCTGRFWEDRFTCKELAGAPAMLACGIYIDLNQIRAGEADTPEASCHTSAHDRITTWQQEQALREQGVEVSGPRADAPDGWLCALTLADGLHAQAGDPLRSATARRASDKGLLPITLEQYLELLDVTGRIVRTGKKGAIPAHLAPILERLGIATNHWSDLVTHYQEWFGPVVGTSQRVVERAKELGVRWLRGQKRCAQVFG
jgi:hypothetical protein